MNQQLKIKALSILVRIGITAEERKTPQEIRVDVELSFPEPPPAVSTDQLEDTVCYARICAALKEVGASREFQTIEKLAGVALEELKRLIPGKTKVRIKIHKVAPPIEGLVGGVVFEWTQDTAV